MTNLLQAIQRVIDNPISDLLDRYKGKNRINDKGVPLEELIKDIFADTLTESNKGVRVSQHSQTFSYLGNQNNPPDFIIKNGDAIEVKKIESFAAGIHLNSSYPKSKLVADDPMILAACRGVDGGNWESKDLIYVIGVVKESKLKRLWLIVGDCLAADYQVYKQIRDRIVMGIGEISDIEFSETKELGRVNKVDPLGITYLRIRGMWGIANPVNVYEYLNIDYDETANLQIIAIMTEQKYNSFPQIDIETINHASVSTMNLNIEDVKIKSPNNPANLINAKLIFFQK